MSWLGLVDDPITLNHYAQQPDGTDRYNNPKFTYVNPVERTAICIYPLHRLPHHDVVDSEFVARVMIDFVLEVPDASLYQKNDKIEIISGADDEGQNYSGTAFLVQGFPFNWGGSNPFGFDLSMIGGSMHVERVT